MEELVILFCISSSLNVALWITIWKEGRFCRGIHVISTAPIGIYGINTQRFSSEGFIAIPNHLLGTEYYAVGMAAEDQHSQVGIIAAERGITTVIITLPDDVDLQVSFCW